MKFSINKEIFKKFSDLNIGVVIAKDIDNIGESEEILSLIKEKSQEIKENYQTDTLSQNPKINAWRKAYSSFGAKPKKNKCSVENLYRMVLNEIELKHINKLVDIYNYISLKHMIPAGGDDIDKIDGNIELTFAEGDEQFTELNSDETKNPKEGEIIYKDDKDVLCRRWNWRECEKSKMTESTKNVAIVVEGLSPFTENEIKEITQELSELIQKYCSGTTDTHILNVNNSEINI